MRSEQGYFVRGSVGGGRERPVPRNPFPSHLPAQSSCITQLLQRAVVEDGGSVMEAEFPLAKGEGGKFDTLEMAGRVPGKLK